MEGHVSLTGNSRNEYFQLSPYPGNMCGGSCFSYYSCTEVYIESGLRAVIQ